VSTAPALYDLLAAARHDRRDLVLSAFRPEQIRWAVTAGLGPWLHRCTRREPAAPESPLSSLVLGADLTARILVAEQLDALEEITDVCARDLPPLTLLKGISLCQQIYPEPHLRTMGDLDILVADDALPAVQSRLVELGYRPTSDYSPEFYAGHHHAIPLFHPRRRVWVEIHRGLLPRSSPVGADIVFSPATVQAERRESRFRGRRVDHLSGELQLVYLASHWAFGLRLERGLIGMLDVIRLLEHAPLRWERILAWLDGSFAATYVCLLLTYLVRRRLIDVDPAVLDTLFRHQRSFGRANLQALHAVLDRHVVEGRPFDRLVSERSFGVVWRTLLTPGRPSRNLLALGWNLLPSRGWFADAVARRG
jgi:Uncharacterised nucleotidyltransferase